MLLKVYLRNEYGINDSPGSISSKLRKCSTIASLKTAMHPYLLPMPDTMSSMASYTSMTGLSEPRAITSFLSTITAGVMMQVSDGQSQVNAAT